MRSEGAQKGVMVLEFEWRPRASRSSGFVDSHRAAVGTDEGRMSAPVELTHKSGRIGLAKGSRVLIHLSWNPTNTKIVVCNDETTPPLGLNLMRCIAQIAGCTVAAPGTDHLPGYHHKLA